MGDLSAGCEFGDGGYEKNVGTKNYQAPEILLGDDHYDEKIDVFSLGLVIAEMILG